MHIMFVCTGNICRSPMGELLLAKYLEDTSLTVSSAGTHGLPQHKIDPSSGKLMASAGIDPSRFLSRRLTAAMAEEADLILCFEKKHRQSVAALSPAATSRTFLLNDFAALSAYADTHSLVRGQSVQQRLESIISAAPLIGPKLPQTQTPEIADPHGKDFAAFQVAATQTNDAIYTVLRSLEK
jgi:protein-tyrosine phosphatase